jgi:hypothetical protein
MGLKDKMLKGIGAREIGFFYHTQTREQIPVYHFRANCSDGRKIEYKDIRSGKGRNRRPCERCTALLQATK